MANPSSVPLIRYDLAYYGVVSEVINATSFRAVGLAGQGDGAFQGYGIYVLKKVNGTTTAPHRERRACATYTSISGVFTHAAFTALLAVGDAILVIHPDIAASVAMGNYPGSTTQNWQAAEQVILTVGGLGTVNKIQSLMLDINALAGNITVRLYTNINAIQRLVYTHIFAVAIDGPGLWIINGTLAISGLLSVSAQSDNAADNGQAIGWEYIIGG